MSQKNPTTLKVEPSQHEATITREFDATREIVFSVMCDGNAIPKWWGTGTHVEVFDARPGGSWAVLNRSANGKESRMRGVFHDVIAPECIIRTFEFMPGKVYLETTSFEDIGGRTKMSVQHVFRSIADRDMMVQYGMDRGANEGYDRLEALLTSYK